ncbi:hypothetical protein LSPH24S_07075 [Lysinibacillus sphaericus]
MTTIENSHCNKQKIYSKKPHESPNGTKGSLFIVFIFLFPNVWVFIGSQVLHALSFALAHFAFIGYLTKNLPKEQIPNAQGLYSALAMGLSTAILAFLGGYLYEISLVSPLRRC